QGRARIRLFHPFSQSSRWGGGVVKEDVTASDHGSSLIGSADVVKRDAAIYEALAFLLDIVGDLHETGKTSETRLELLAQSVKRVHASVVNSASEDELAVASFADQIAELIVFGRPREAYDQIGHYLLSL